MATEGPGRYLQFATESEQEDHRGHQRAREHQELKQMICQHLTPRGWSASHRGSSSSESLAAITNSYSYTLSGAEDASYPRMQGNCTSKTRI